MEGFKQTDIGWIPEDWEVKELSMLSSKIGDGIHTTPIYCNSSEYRFINGNNLLRGKIEYNENTEYVSFREYVKYKKNLINNTILYSINGTIGNIAFYNGEKIVLGKSAAYINLKDIIHKYFVYYSLQSSLVLGYYRNELTGSTINNLSLSTLNNTPILLPPLPEQEAIAKALSDVDSLIDALERKIAKKRNIKQGAMQRLLLGKQRLPGFSGDWVEKKLGEILSIGYGKSQHEVEDVNGNIPILGTGGLMGYSNTYLYDKPSVLIGRKGTIDKPEYIEVPFWTIDTLYYSKIFNDVSAKFVYYLFCTVDWYAYNEASGVPSLNAKTVESISLLFPPSKAEQSAIAQILTNMDNEITTLEQKLNKYKQIKQGMMQQLLTGKIRLL